MEVLYYRLLHRQIELSGLLSHLYKDKYNMVQVHKSVHIYYHTLHFASPTFFHGMSSFSCRPVVRPGIGTGNISTQEAVKRKIISRTSHSTRI